MGDNESNRGHWEAMGDKGRQELAEGRRTIQHRHTYAGRQWGDKTSGRRTHLPTQAHMCHNGRQWETRGDKTSGRRTHHPTGTHAARQWETRGDKTPWEGGHSIQHRLICRETMGDKTSGRRTHHSTQAHMWGDNGRQGGAMGDKGRQDFRKAGIASNTTPAHMSGDNGDKWRQGETMGDKGETRPLESGQAHMWGVNGRTMGDNGRQWETRGDKGRQDFGKGDTPSNTGKNTCSDQFWTFRCRFAWQAQGDCAPCQKWAKRDGFVAVSKNVGRRGPFEEDLRRCMSRGRRSTTRDMFIGDVRRSGRWFPERGCILEHDIFRFAKMIFRDRCSTSYDLASLFRGRRSTLDSWNGKITKRIGTRPSGSARSRNFPIFEGTLADLLHFSYCPLRKMAEVSQNCFVFDVAKFKNWESIAEMLRFWCCQVQKRREISQNSFVFKLAARQIDRLDNYNSNCN